MDDVVYQENGLFPIILDQICSWKIFKESDFMVSQGGGTQFVILQGGGTCDDMVYQEERLWSNYLRPYM